MEVEQLLDVFQCSARSLPNERTRVRRELGKAGNKTSRFRRDPQSVGSRLVARNLLLLLLVLLLLLCIVVAAVAAAVACCCCCCCCGGNVQIFSTMNQSGNAILRESKRDHRYFPIASAVAARTRERSSESAFERASKTSRPSREAVRRSSFCARAAPESKETIAAAAAFRAWLSSVVNILSNAPISDSGDGDVPKASAATTREFADFQLRD